VTLELRPSEQDRRKLLADLRRHVDPVAGEQPALLTLFDLNGFKNYNDSFGHPAATRC
jgi:GGDEF domain-containing protein